MASKNVNKKKLNTRKSTPNYLVLLKSFNSEQNAAAWLKKNYIKGAYVEPGQVLKSFDKDKISGKYNVVIDFNDLEKAYSKVKSSRKAVVLGPRGERITVPDSSTSTGSTPAPQNPRYRGIRQMTNKMQRTNNPGLRDYFQRTSPTTPPTTAPRSPGRSIDSDMMGGNYSPIKTAPEMTVEEMVGNSRPSNTSLVTRRRQSGYTPEELAARLKAGQGIARRKITPETGLAARRKVGTGNELATTGSALTPANRSIVGNDAEDYAVTFPKTERQALPAPGSSGAAGAAPAVGLATTSGGTPKRGGVGGFLGKFGRRALLPFMTALALLGGDAPLGEPRVDSSGKPAYLEGQRDPRTDVPVRPVSLDPSENTGFIYSDNPSLGSSTNTMTGGGVGGNVPAPDVGSGTDADLGDMSADDMVGGSGGNTREKSVSSRVMILKSFSSYGEADKWIRSLKIVNATVEKTSGLKSIGHQGGIPKGNYHVIKY